MSLSESIAFCPKNHIISVAARAAAPALTRMSTSVKGSDYFCPLGPPRVAFSWRHWAHWTGPYKERAPTGELLELRGMAVAEVDDNLKIKSIDVHFDPNQLLMKLEGKK